MHRDTQVPITILTRGEINPLPSHHRSFYAKALFQRGHECKATHRLSTAVFLRFGPCRSRKRFRPKYCGVCPVPGVSCQPTLSTTVKVEFLCEGNEIFLILFIWKEYMERETTFVQKLIILKSCYVIIENIVEWFNLMQINCYQFCITLKALQS